LPDHVDNFPIQGRVAASQGFKAKLLVLSIPPLLGSLVSEDGGEVIEPYRLGQVMHAMLDIGTADGGRALRAQRHRRATTILEGVGLLLHNIGAGTDGANEKASILEDRGIDALIAVKLAQRG